jgi:hypothetical protein
MEVEGHEDVFISKILVREGEAVSPKVCVALAVDLPEELGAAFKMPSAEEICALERRDEHQFMWQVVVFLVLLMHCHNNNSNNNDNNHNHNNNNNNMWQGYVRNVSDSSGMCDKGACS